ncbi:phage tail assembly chaperone [Paenibacillus dendritiformis]|uniref:phage tail assembly chaperone n=1 Tax=Paenibacillus dendritiformis TaxID=130049 RepID=UPI000DA81D38|nr:phage portal protein [Paenibacillus dendritiformis]PZM65344.1 phage portal protein [Paenibacillus dendritiformis]
MSTLSAFFAQNVEGEVTEELVVSQRFKDANGKPIPWKLRSMTEAENEQCRKAATKKVKGKGGAVTPEIDFNEYTAKLIVGSVEFPDLKNVELQQSYGVMGAEALLRKMLLPGEYTNLLQQVQALNGFDKSEQDLVDEVKN